MRVLEGIWHSQMDRIYAEEEIDRLHEWLDGWMDGWMDGWIDERLMDGWMDGWMN